MQWQIKLILTEHWVGDLLGDIAPSFDAVTLNFDRDEVVESLRKFDILNDDLQALL